MVQRIEEIEAIERSSKRAKLMQQYQEYMATVGSDKNNPVLAPVQVGELAGRSVKCVTTTDSKESRTYREHMTSSEKDRVRTGFTNSVKEQKS